MKNISVNLPAEVLARLDAVSKRRSMSRSSLVRDALQRFLGATPDSPAPGSFAEQAADLAGSFKGPRDLSHAPGHMRGYGGETARPPGHRPARRLTQRP